jgi:hypothetical protein
MENQDISQDTEAPLFENTEDMVNVISRGLDIHMYHFQSSQELWDRYLQVQHLIGLVIPMHLIHSTKVMHFTIIL